MVKVLISWVGCFWLRVGHGGDVRVDKGFGAAVLLSRGDAQVVLDSSTVPAMRCAYLDIVEFGRLVVAGRCMWTAW